MTIQETIHRFIVEHNVVDLGSVTYLDEEKTTVKVFYLNYYDTYTLLALAKKNILYLTEDILKLLKPHKKKLFFKLYYDPKFDSYELLGLYFKASMQVMLRLPRGKKGIGVEKKCEKPLFQIKHAFDDMTVGTSIENISGKSGETYASIKINPLYT